MASFCFTKFLLGTCPLSLILKTPSRREWGGTLNTRKLWLWIQQFNHSGYYNEGWVRWLQGSPTSKNLWFWVQCFSKLLRSRLSEAAPVLHLLLVLEGLEEGWQGVTTGCCAWSSAVLLTSHPESDSLAAWISLPQSEPLSFKHFL